MGKKKNPENSNKTSYEHRKLSCKVLERKKTSEKLTKKEHGTCTESNKWNSY